MKMFRKYQLAVWLSIQNFYSHFTKITRKCKCFGCIVEPCAHVSGLSICLSLILEFGMTWIENFGILSLELTMTLTSNVESTLKPEHQNNIIQTNHDNYVYKHRKQYT